MVIRSVNCQYNLFDEENDLEKREYNIPSKIAELLEDQLSLYTELDGIHLMHNVIFILSTFRTCSLYALQF